MSISEDLSTELAAVNIMLAGQGENPVESLDATTSALTSKAQKALYEASRSIQLIGWYWNKETDWDLPKASDDRIPLPANTLKVNQVRGAGSSKIVQRGNYLYDATNHTYFFTDVDTVTVDVTIYLTWEELPEAARHPILYLASRRFQMRELTSTAIDSALRDDFDAAKATLEHAEDENGPANILDDSIDQGLFGDARRRSR